MDDFEIADLADDTESLARDLEEARRWLKACLGLVEGAGPPNWDGIRDFLKRTD